MIQWTCTGGDSQHWKIAPASGGGGYALVSVHSGLLLTVAGTSGGAALVQQPAGAPATQTWTLGTA